MHFVCCLFDPTMEQFPWYKGDVGQYVKTMQVGKFQNLIEKVIQNLSKWPFSERNLKLISMNLFICFLIPKRDCYRWWKKSPEAHLLTWSNFNPSMDK